jgi:hypothetical protein
MPSNSRIWYFPWGSLVVRSSDVRLGELTIHRNLWGGLWANDLPDQRPVLGSAWG